MKNTNNEMFMLTCFILGCLWAILLIKLPVVYAGLVVGFYLYLFVILFLIAIIGTTVLIKTQRNLKG